MTTEYTSTLRLNKPDFRDPGWSTLVNDNMDNLDRAIAAALAGANFEVWANNTVWNEGEIAIDTAVTPSAYYICNVTHTSALAPTTFAADRAAHPTYWSVFLFNYRPRGAWTHDTQYLINDIVYDTTLGITGICKTAHISNHAGTINDDAIYWDYIVNLPTSLPANQISFNKANLNAAGIAAASNNVQAIIDEMWIGTLEPVRIRVASLETSRTTDEANIATNTANIATLQAQQAKDGFDIGDVKISILSIPRSGWVVMNDGTVGNAVSGATLRANADQFTLFDLLYSYPNTVAPVSGGRGASSAADFAAGKTIGVLKVLGRAIIAAGSGSGLTARTAGVIGGEESHIITYAEMTNHNHGGATGIENVDHTHASGSGLLVSSHVPSSTGGGGFGFDYPNGYGGVTSGRSVGATHSIAADGSGVAHNNMQPFQAMFVHIRAY